MKFRPISFAALLSCIGFASCAQQSSYQAGDQVTDTQHWADWSGPAPLPAELEVRNFLPLSNQVASGGPPSAQSIAEMRDLGYTTIINLRTSAESGVAEEAQLAAQAGLRYIHLPVRTSGIDLAYAAEVREALRSAEGGKVLLHCGSGGRVSAVWGLARALEEGLSEEEAVAAAQQAGMRSSRLESRVRESVPVLD